jgi:WD40 repeat protein
MFRLVGTALVLVLAVLTAGCRPILSPGPTPGIPSGPPVGVLPTAGVSPNLTTTATATEPPPYVAPTTAPVTVEPTETSAGPTPIAVLPKRVGLSGDGPHLIHWERGDPTTGRLVVRDADGAPVAVWRLPDGSTVGRLSDAISPDGRWLAFTTGGLPDWHFQQPYTNPLTLHIWDLDTGAEAFSRPIVRSDIVAGLRCMAEAILVDYRAPQLGPCATPQSNAATSPPPTSTPAATSSVEPEEMMFEDVFASFADAIGAVSWSPDGTRLAFGAAIDGRSSDLYVLKTADWSVTRISDEPDQLTHFAWSPDSRWLVWESSDYAPRGSGYASGSSPSAGAPDGSNVRRLGRGVFDGTNMGAWQQPWVDGWDSGGVYLHSVNNGCGICELWRFDLATGQGTAVVAEMGGESIAVGAPGKGIAVSVWTGDNGEIDYYSSAGASPKVIYDRVCSVHRWDVSGLPFVMLPSYGHEQCPTAAFSSEGRMVTLDASGESASVAPAGPYRLIYGKTGWALFDATSADPRHAVSRYSEPVQSIAWRPDGKALLWLTDKRLWFSELPPGNNRDLGHWRGNSVVADVALNVAWVEAPSHN